jgi:triacylglycerol lipase
VAQRHRRLRIWAAGLLPLIVVVAVLGGLTIRNRLGAGGSAAGDGPGPVLLVAGYGGSTRALTVLAGQLRSQGRDVVIVPATGDNTGDLAVQAQTLERVAGQRIAAGAPSVDVVGYSAGGVVARLWAAGAGAQIARRIVTLGSPHHGTDVAGVAAGLVPGACPVACQQLEPRSPLLRALPELPDGPDWVSIYTANDDLVIPPDTARLRGAVNIELQLVCPDAQVTHGQLPRDPLTIGLVEQALRGSGLRAAPPLAQCAQLRAAGSR